MIMSDSALSVSIGQCSAAGVKQVNQDFYGACIPVGLTLNTKGIAAAVADGISSSDVSHVASESAVKSFLIDYYCTSDAWSVKKSAYRVLSAINSWLHAQTQNGPSRYDRDKGYICTFSGLILRMGVAHLFHVGDSRIYRIRDGVLESLTHEHCHGAEAEARYLTRALGLKSTVILDYKTIPLSIGDVFILMTDGVYEYLDDQAIQSILDEYTHDLDRAAEVAIERGLSKGSGDNLTVQILRVESVPSPRLEQLFDENCALPPAPQLSVNEEFEGYRVLRDLYCSARSHVYLAEDLISGKRVVIKVPSVTLREDPRHLEQFQMEEWIASRISNNNVIKAVRSERARLYLYSVFEYFEGMTLAQWMLDNPQPSLEKVRSIVAQIGYALRAFQRLEMVHQDVRPENILISEAGAVKLIDFGSAKVLGLSEWAFNEWGVFGTLQYSAPEYFIGETGSHRSDLFSLGVVTYQMLCGRLPYGNAVSRTQTRREQQKLRYSTLRLEDREIPVWVNFAVKRALEIDPLRRYDEVSEFVHDLRYPNRMFLADNRPPLMERDPLLFWQVISLILLLLLIASIAV